MENKILDRVRALLNNSKHNPSAEEAALMAERAAELMFKHQITEADLAVEAAPEAEAVEESDVDSGSRNRVMWKCCLANGLAQGFGCKMWSSRDTGKFRLHFLGLQSAVQTVQYMFGLLCLEIERAADLGYAAHRAEHHQTARVWKNAFRLGAACKVQARLEAQRRTQMGQVAKMRTEARVATYAYGEPEAQRAQTEAKCTALARWNGDEQRVEAAYAKRSKRFRNIKGARISSPSAFHRGQAAGANLSLGGRRGLPAAKSRLEG